MVIQAARESVISDFNKKKASNLEGIKFFTGDIANVTEEHFYEQADKLNRAIIGGKAKSLCFGDSML
ncbi:MAG: hypothetical protein HFP77_07290 [Methylococcales symbiont of Iophon sp. n. MRB-2018]|nr:MAG: hypothetical protein HFP77_07290 [Methylococcales symbiont of Iophon sp. n. MRB-2018]KAF3979638.1 MAG: hypothetical protein HFP76_06360 [Methylococcales symbiont of Iophon sp. n. MRB-2018]